jgi:hypothetical protein
VNSAMLAKPVPSRFGAFGHPAFAAIWSASTILNIGTAMFDTGSAWLMTSLNADPMAVSLVQAAAGLPIVLFTLPAGALADLIDSRWILIAVEIAIIVVIAAFAMLVWPRHSCRIVADDLFAERRLFADGAGAAVDHASPGNQGGTRKRDSCQWGRLQRQPRRGACSRGLSHHRIWNCRAFLARWRRQSRAHRCATLVALASERGRKAVGRASDERRPRGFALRRQ